MICQRCAKDTSDIHTCTPTALVRELEAQLAAMTQDFTDYKHMTDLAYKSSEQETLDKLAASQAREASWKQQAEDAALTISGLLKDLADKHSVFCPHCNPCRHAEELAAMTRERDGAVAILEQTLVGISFGELLKAYAAYRAGEKYETVVDRVEAQLAAMTAERDEAVAAVQKLSEGQPFQTVVVADVVRRGLEQLAASQAREQQLREALLEYKAMYEGVVQMSRLDEIAGQGPVAWINKRGDHVDISSDCTVYGSHTIPLYTTDPAPLVALIRQLGGALNQSTKMFDEHSYRQMLDGRMPCKLIPEALAALAEFDKGEQI